jgi:hypothetical protein
MQAERRRFIVVELWVGVAELEVAWSGGVVGDGWDGLLDRRDVVWLPKVRVPW